MSIIKPYKPISDNYKNLLYKIRCEYIDDNKVYSSKYLYIIDNGHGGIIDDEYQTSGKRSPRWDDGKQVFEGDFNRSVSHKLASLLMYFCGIDFKLVAPEDNDVRLWKRVDRANEIQRLESKQCIYLSIHANASRWESACGFEVWTYKGQNVADELAEKIYENVLTITDLEGRHDITDGDHDKENDVFYVLSQTTMPSLLTENGFMTNKKESDLMLTEDFQDTVAWYHFLGILELENIM